MHKYYYLSSQQIIISLMLTQVIIALLLCAVCAGGKLPIQAHSFNDLNYVKNLISKGIDYYKLDISMANRKSCQQYSTWNKTKKCYKTSQYIQQICCLALRGDASSRPSFYYNFNTSDDIVAFFQSTLSNIITYQPKRRLLFAINFQYSHSFDDFISEEFLSKIADIMNKYPNNLLLGTGSDSFILEYDRICYGKGAPQCNDIRRKISKTSMFLQSGSMNPFDPRDYYKRFRNFNIFYQGIAGHCQHGFPEWINKYPEFPLIFWEPSNQRQIQYVLNYYLSPSCMKMHKRNLSGMAMASNIDPQMFDVYLKKLIQPATFSKWLLPYSDTQLSIQNISWSIVEQKLLIPEQNKLKLTKIKKGNSQIVFTGSTNMYTHKLLIQKWEYDQKSLAMKLTANRQYTIINQNETVQNLFQDGLGNIIVITYQERILNPHKIYYFNSETLDLITYKDWPRLEAAFMRNNELIFVTCLNQVENCTIKGAIDLRQTNTYASFNTRYFMSKITSIESYGKDFILVGHGSDIKDLSVAVLIRDGQLIAPARPLSLGQNPKIFKKQFGKQYGVLLSNSMCHSALLINNNDMNKCNFFKQPQFQSLRNVRGLVNLLQFNMDDLLKNEEVVSPCHAKISLTKVMNGADSDIIELLGANSYLISSEYLRVEYQDLVSALFCGASNFDKVYRYRTNSSMLTTMYLSNKNSLNEQKMMIQSM